MFHVAIVVILSIVSVVGIIGNLFIIGSVCLYKRLRVRGNVFIVNLAIADLIIVAYIMPVGLATSQFLVNPFSSTMCEVNAFLTITSCGVSTQSLMLIALERYFHICRMHIYRKAFTPKLIGLYVAIIWVYTTAWTCHGWTGWTLFVFGEHVYLCIFSGPFSLSYDICLAFFGMILPMIVLAVCYYKIFRTVVRSRRAITAHRKKAEKRNGSENSGETSQLHKPEAEKQADREFRLIITLFTIVIVFCVCWVPACIVVLMSSLWPGMPKTLYTVSIWLAVCNSGMNSFIYGILNNNFRRGYKQLLQHILCCMVFKKRGKCSQCRGLLEDKDSSSESHVRSGATKHTKTSTNPTSQSHSESSNTRSGASTETKDVSLVDSQNLGPAETNLELSSTNPRTTQLQPIKYEEEPESAAPIGKQNSVHVTLHNQSASDQIIPVNDTSGTPVSMTDSFFGGGNPPSQTGSQSSLIRRSITTNSEVGSVDNASFVRQDSQCTDSIGGYSRPNSQSTNRTHPPNNIIRPRPSSGHREISMSNVVLEETKM